MLCRRRADQMENSVVIGYEGTEFYADKWKILTTCLRGNIIILQLDSPIYHICSIIKEKKEVRDYGNKRNQYEI